MRKRNMPIGERERNLGLLSVLVVLLIPWMIAACATAKAKPNKTDAYFQNWNECEADLKGCREACDEVMHP